MAGETTLRGRAWGDLIVVVSPHLDDAALSVGATIAALTDAGSRVLVVTVLAGDPTSERPADDWDRRAGFSTVGEAARARREEDRLACELLGATPVWLPFDESTASAISDDEIWSAALEAMSGADLVLVPGHPLEHEGHVRVAKLFRDRGFAGVRHALYVEQPYAARGHPPPRPGDPKAGGVTWSVVPASRPSRKAKMRACRAYRSQVRLLSGMVSVVRRIAWYERRRGGETIGRTEAS